MKTLITIVVPVYNVEKYLNKCVESIVNQTYENLEIILVDDGSPDNCPQMCDEWAKKDCRIKVVHKKNGGLSSARNAGIDAMTGDYVLFIDSDDYIELNMAEIMYTNIIKDNYDVCVCNNSHTDKNYNIISTTGFKGTVLKGDEIIQSFLKTTVFDSSSTCNKMYKYSVLEKYNLRFDETIKWGEDYPFNYYYFRVIDKMISIDDVLYHYLMEREGSITDNVTSGSVSRWQFVRMSMLEEKDNKVNYKIALSKYASELMCTLRELLNSGNKELINQHFAEITDEIKEYYKEFMTLSDLNKKIRLSLKIINFSPIIFKVLYNILYR